MQIIPWSSNGLQFLKLQSFTITGKLVSVQRIVLCTLLGMFLDRAPIQACRDCTAINDSIILLHQWPG